MVSKRISKKESRVKDNQLHDYELVLVISPEVEEEKVDATIDSVSQFITDRDGSVYDLERMGKKRLAYPIKHFVDGNYVVARFQMKPTSGKELEMNLRISDEVLRHLLVRVNN